MGSEEKTKTCKICYREIPGPARKCPYCRTIQDWVHTTLVNPNVLAPLMGALMLFGLGFLGFIVWSMTDHRADFADYRGQLQVVRSEMVFGEDEDGKSVSVVGTIRNNSQVTWGGIDVEARFFDADGKLVDTGSGGSSVGVVLPGSERTFRVEVPAYLPQERYVTHKVFIQYAVEPGGRF